LFECEEEASTLSFEVPMIQFMIERLNYEISLHSSVIISPFHQIFQSDELVSKEKKSNFLKSLQKFQKVSTGNWRPQSQNIILDLLHPSLFCLVFGRTFVTNEKLIQRDKNPFYWTGNGSIIPILEKPEIKETKIFKLEIIPDEEIITSRNYQWIPSEIKVSEEGKVTFESYINNLNPLEHKSLYKSLEDILEDFLLMFEKVMIPGSTIIHRHGNEMEKLHNGYNSLFMGTKNYGDIHSDIEYDDGEDEHPHENFLENEFEAPEHEKKLNFKGCNLQIFVKLRNFELTPESPQYKGGIWHMEGMKNENIMASLIYCYSSHNVTDSKVSFRQSIMLPELSNFSDYREFCSLFGINEGGKMNQLLGSVQLFEDRCIAFPYYYEHRISEFELVDKTKKGHLKLLEFHLVNHSSPIISTASVPPQQKNWVGDIYKIILQDIFPTDIIENIFSYLSCTMHIHEANDFKINLTDERRVMYQIYDQILYERPVMFPK
jgi:hypothetical protein